MRVVVGYDQPPLCGAFSDFESFLTRVVHGSGGNSSKTRNRRTYVLAYRPQAVVDAERRIGFTHSHNDSVNWDTFENV